MIKNHVRVNVELGALHPQLLATSMKEFERLGYGFSLELIKVLKSLSNYSFIAWHQKTLEECRKAKADSYRWRPMYPGFPDQVMAMSDVDLYINAMVRYITEFLGGEMVTEEVQKRFPLIGRYDLDLLYLDTPEWRAEQLMNRLNSKAGISAEDREIIIQGLRENWCTLPPEIAFKETAMFVCRQLLLMGGETAICKVAEYVKTATDVLRLATAMSDGDISLATNTRFRSFTRAERRILLGLLDRCGYDMAVEDVARNQERFIRLGERLHPGEFKQFANAQRLFVAARSDENIDTFNSRVERALSLKDIGFACRLLLAKPGEFARRLDHLLRLENQTDPADHCVLGYFKTVADKVASPILLQLIAHFAVRDVKKQTRVFMPKGNVAKAMGIDDTLDFFSIDTCLTVMEICETALTKIYGQKDPLGKVYVDPELVGYKVPSALRSASKSLRTIARGSKLPFDQDAKVARFFLWWKQPAGDRTDIDLSALLYNENWKLVDTISFYNIRGKFACHSGDITSAPNGACEFIDVDIDKAKAHDVRYVVMNVHAYTSTPFCNLPECFAGWMARKDLMSGEIFEPATIQDRFDLTSDSGQSTPLVLDLKERKMLWADLSMQLTEARPGRGRCAEGTRKGVEVLMPAMFAYEKADLYTLFSIHANARGTQVYDPAEADVVFSPANAFDLPGIAASFM